MNTDATKLILYSDACGGQNRNIYLICLWMHVIASSEYPFPTIDYKFMVSGHSYLPNDRDFGCVELSRGKTAHIFVPEHWEQVVTQARSKNPCVVSKMERENFVSLETLKQAIVNLKVTADGAKISWLKMHWISVSKDKPLQFRFRYSNNTSEAWKTVDLKKKPKADPQTWVT